MAVASVHNVVERAKYGFVALINRLYFFESDAISDVVLPVSGAGHS